MAVYKRGGTYWFEFIFQGRRIRKSTMQANRRAAENIESAYRTKLANGLVGLEEKRVAPSLKKAFESFLALEQSRTFQSPEYSQALPNRKQTVVSLL